MAQLIRDTMNEVASNSNGFWKVRHEDMAALLRRTDLGWELVRVLLAVADCTHGRGNPDGSLVSVSQITDLAHVDRRHVSRALRRLAHLGLYGQDHEGDGPVRRWVVWPVPPIASQGDIALRGASASQGNSAIASQGAKVSPPKATTKTRQERYRKKCANTTRFTAPTPQEVTAYAESIEFALDGHQFVDFYQARGWLIGKTPMKDWHAAVRTWKTRDRQRGETNSGTVNPSEFAAMMTHEATEEELAALKAEGALS
jgi:hypothetical protein